MHYASAFPSTLVRSGRIGVFSELSSELLPPEWCGMLLIGVLSERTSLGIYMNLSGRLALDRLNALMV
jgi:hypothetical protein